MKQGLIFLTPSAWTHIEVMIVSDVPDSILLTYILI